MSKTTFYIYQQEFQLDPLFLVVAWLVVVASHAQERKDSTFYYQRSTLFEELTVTSEDIIFLGNSITNGEEWY